jgi:Ca2+-binding RTX toxin-like protein
MDLLENRLAPATFAVDILDAPLTSPEGTAIALSSSLNPVPVTATYSWSVTKDGNPFGSVGTEAAFSFTPDDNGAYVVTLSVGDGTDTFSDNVTIDVTNVAPTAGISGPANAVRGQTVTYVLSASDPSSADAAAGFTYEIDWNNDGTVDETVVGGASVEVTRAYTDEGSHTISVTATDKDLGESTAVTLTTTVTAFAIQPDPGDPTKTALVVGGTTGDDRINIVPKGRNGVRLLINGKSQGVFSPTGSIIMYGQAGNDHLHLAGSIRLKAILHGDDGNDVLQGGKAGDVLLGGIGLDHLLGKQGPDILIGGENEDRLVGNEGDDILIGGSTAIDSDDAALAALAMEWAAGGDITPPTVTDDGAVDMLTGAAGTDWFFATEGSDVITDQKPFEAVNALSLSVGNSGPGKGKGKGKK